MVWSPLFRLYHGYRVTLRFLPQYIFSTFHPKNTFFFSCLETAQAIFINSKGYELVEPEPGLGSF